MLRFERIRLHDTAADAAKDDQFPVVDSDANEVIKIIMLKLENASVKRQDHLLSLDVTMMSTVIF